MATRICPQCGTETQAPFCRADGFATVDAGRYTGRDLHVREGDVIAARYRLDQFLGRSPLGSTYRATDQRLQVPVAVRLLAPGIATDLGLIARFQREGRLVASLAHPNIVRVMEHGVAEDGTLYIAQELVAGPTLAEALARGGPFDPTRVVSFGREILDALAEAHTHGVLHRSLGLDNIVIVTRPGGGETLKISDFGLVHVLADDNATPFVFPQVLSGAWRAMAPEQARGRGVSGHADLYSVGCLLYELLTGKPVFGEGSPSDLLVAHSVKMAPPPEREGRMLSGPLVELIVRCLEKKPWNRPDGAQKALDLLELSRGQPILPMPSPTAEFAAPRADAVSTRPKPKTNPFGTQSPMSAPTRPNIAAIEPMSVPTDGKGLVRPTGGNGSSARPRRVVPSEELSAAPRSASEPTGNLTRNYVPGATAARAESTDRGFASRADLKRDGREDFEPRRRSPLLWFLAGVAVAALIAFLVVRFGLGGNDAADAGVARIETPAEASPTPHATQLAGTLADTGAAGVHAAADADVHEANAPDAAGTPERMAAADVTDTAGPIDTTSQVALAETIAPTIDTNEVAVPTAPRPAGEAADETKGVKREARPRVVDPLADLEDPEFAAPKNAPGPKPELPSTTLRKVLVDSEPLGARIAIGGRFVGETPMIVEWHGDGVDVVLSKVGYRSATRRLTATSGRSVRVALLPVVD